MPICIRDTPTTTLLLYAVAVIGYIPASVYCVTADWFAVLVLVLPFPKSQRISSIDHNELMLNAIFVPVFWFVLAVICIPFLACVLLPTITVVCAFAVIPVHIAVAWIVYSPGLVNVWLIFCHCAVFPSPNCRMIFCGFWPAVIAVKSTFIGTDPWTLAVAICIAILSWLLMHESPSTLPSVLFCSVLIVRRQLSVSWSRSSILMRHRSSTMPILFFIPSSSMSSSQTSPRPSLSVSI